MKEQQYMRLAIEQAKLATIEGEIPVGAIIIKDDKIISQAYNKTICNFNATEHAEMIAIREACIQLSSPYLNDCTLYVTLEPCPMCSYAISLSRISKVYFGSYRDIRKDKDLKEIYGGFCEEECAQLLTAFFNSIR